MSEQLLSWLTNPLQAALPFPAQTHAASLLAALLMTYLCVHPVIAFCRRGWKIKRSDILSSVDDQAKARYLQTFFQQSADGSKPRRFYLELLLGDSGDFVRPGNPMEEFTRIYNHRYGRYRLIWPIVLLVITVFVLSYLVSESALARISPLCDTSTGICPVYLVLPDKAIAAIAGAYTWIVYALARDASKYIMPPQSILMVVLRLLVAAPLGYAVASLATDGLGNFLAFAIGAFPLGTIQVIMQRIANKNLGLSVGAAPDGIATNSGQVTKLDGVDLPTADRLEEGDITTISQLAYCDPVQLSMRTNLAFDAVTDLVNQALAYLYFGNQLEKMRLGGIRGAIEIRSFETELEQKDPEAEKAFQILADQLGQKPETLRRAFKEIATDPYTIFLSHAWGRRPDSLKSAPTTPAGATIAPAPTLVAGQ